MRVRNLLAVWLTAVFVVSFSAYAENDTVNLARMSGVKCTASGTLDGYAPERVTDGADTEWISAWDSGEVQWIQIDLGEERKITQIVLTPRKNGYNPETTTNLKCMYQKLRILILQIPYMRRETAHFRIQKSLMWAEMTHTDM